MHGKLSCSFIGWLFLISPCVTQASLIWLNDGRLLHGEIREYSATAVVVQCLDREGTVEILWQEIHPVCCRRLKGEIGLIEQREASWTIPGVKIYLRNGQIVLGKIVADQKQKLVVEASSSANPVRIGKDNIYKTEEIKIPITAIYSPERIYEIYQREYDLKSADGNLKFAQFLMKAGVDSQAKIHLEKAQELQPELSGKVESLLAQITQQREEGDREQALRQLKYCRRNQRYGEALQLLKSLEKHLGGEYAVLLTEISREQKEYLGQEVPKRWFKKVAGKIGHLCRDRSVALEEARNYALGVMPGEIVEELAQEFQVASETVEEYFAQRAGGPSYQFSYGEGTFIVASFSSKSQKGPGDDRSAKFTSSDTWWQDATSTSRSQWLGAYYCENSLTGVTIGTKDCLQCKGKGKYLQKRKAVICSVCHGCGHERIVEIK